MESGEDGSSHVNEWPSQKKVIAGVDIQHLELRVEFCGAHLDGQVHCSQRISLYTIECSDIDLVLLKLSEVKPLLL